MTKSAKRQQNDQPVFFDLLKEVNPDVAQSIDIDLEPGRAFRTLYDGWVQIGGAQPGGHRRRSVNQIKSWLGVVQKVRSLETKLTGRTIFQRDDIVKLMRLFLRRWRYDSKKEDDKPYPGPDIENFLEALVNEVCDQQSGGLRLPARSRSTEAGTSGGLETPAPMVLLADKAQPSGDAITDLYHKTDALITVSREQTFIGVDPGTTMLGFHALMDRLREIDEADGRFRTLIWIVDLGRREEDGKSQIILQNLDFLATQFRGLLMTEHPAREARAQWFQERAAVLVGTLKHGEIDARYAAVGLKLPEPPRDRDWITADRLFFVGIPDSWIVRMAEAGQVAIEKRTITVHRDLSEQRMPEMAGEGEWDDLSYRFHASLAGPDGKLSPRCLDMPRDLGVRWRDAFRIAHEAALHRLGRPFEPTMPFTPEESLSLLREHRFAVLRTNEFCQLTNRLAFGEPEK